MSLDAKRVYAPELSRSATLHDFPAKSTIFTRIFRSERAH